MRGYDLIIIKDITEGGIGEVEGGWGDGAVSAREMAFEEGLEVRAKVLLWRSKVAVSAREMANEDIKGGPLDAPISLSYPGFNSPPGCRYIKQSVHKLVLPLGDT